MLARRQLSEERRFLKEQNEIARSQAQLTERGLAEQNARVRLNLEVDLLFGLEDRFDSEHTC